MRDELIQQYEAAEPRLVDDIIEPARTRGYLADALETLSTKRDWRPQK